MLAKMYYDNNYISIRFNKNDSVLLNYIKNTTFSALSHSILNYRNNTENSFKYSKK